MKYILTAAVCVVQVPGVAAVAGVCSGGDLPDRGPVLRPLRAPHPAALPHALPRTGIPLYSYVKISTVSVIHGMLRYMFSNNIKIFIEASKIFVQIQNEKLDIFPKSKWLCVRNSTTQTQ